MNVLYAYHTNPSYMAPARFAENQITCGPGMPDSFEGGNCISLNTSPGAYDLAKVLERIPPHQKPDLFVVKADASRVNLPRNIGCVKCLKVLIVGDTQHMCRPIQTMVGYALSEPYDIIMTDHIRRNLHYFGEVGFKRTYWIPGINLNVFDTVPDGDYLYPISFIGQYGRYHPVRRHLLRGVFDAGLPLHVRTASQRDAARIYANSQVNLNISLNGDINLRLFEVTAHCGLLLTDELPPLSGQLELYHQGSEILTFEGLENLIGLARELLASPGDCAAIANRGYARFLRDHAPEVRMAQFFDMLEGRPVPEYLLGEADPRQKVPCRWVPEEFWARLSIYEVAQELNRINPAGLVVAFPGVDTRLLECLADLSRLVVVRVSEDTECSGEDAENGRLDRRIFDMPLEELPVDGIRMVLMDDASASEGGWLKFCADNELVAYVHGPVSDAARRNLEQIACLAPLEGVLGGYASVKAAEGLAALLGR